jgi:threonyl-tRNA synthetase
MIKKVMDTFGFKYRYRLSTRDPANKTKYLGDPKVWDKVEKWAEIIMKRNKIDYFDGPGEAAFYAPKMDLMATDSLGREWQLSTVQIDYVQPSRFDLKYTAADGSEKMPVMIHRAILGSTERMLMVLIEHYAGAFPAWLAPEQVRIVPIGENNITYAKKIKTELDNVNVRSEIDVDNERMQNKIRKAQELKVPYMLIVGKNEEASQTVSLRYRNGEEIKDMKLNNFLDKLTNNISQRRSEIVL